MSDASGLETACGPYVPAPPVEDRWTLADGSFIVLAMRESQGVPVVTAVPLRAEWSAHDVAESYVALGCRAFFIDTDTEDGEPTIEEYHGG